MDTPARDTGSFSEVEAIYQREDDEGPNTDALYGGDDVDAAQEALENPGVPVNIDEVDADE